MAKEKKNKRSRAARTAEAAARRLEEMKLRGESKWVEVRQSEIHGTGVYAACDILEDTEIIEYVGEPVDKEESERRAWAQMAKAEKDGDAAVYIFTLNEEWDLDGSVEWNAARLINHSCDPNCIAYTVEGDGEDRIIIYALRDIEKGEELTFDYGFDLECYEDHPCRCGAANCIGYIVSQEQWPELRKLLKKKN
ncbi:SET domain-containing protein [Roseibacillus ishigakijimensis]|uniref:SET domain-containing protein-lysine N-methyltransferase n=1 Tax=Roseibacillus ishigakijimensis TaxID=454146 RepID=A0A934RRP1_9BACT|nr:SET domain-containing protein-lysine N-methyltransferase [Roseibacillus ishigakijimensis]MBK1834223.1 SET domain-containing protein-lysine N-methyltransferase [Roseibacillus ishigakijimensis]